MLRDSFDNPLTLEAMQSAFEALRRDISLTDHPLMASMLVQRKLNELHHLLGLMPYYMLFDVLAAFLTEQLTILHIRYDLQPPEPDLNRIALPAALAHIGATNNSLLIGGNAVYYRYLRTDLDLQMQGIAVYLHQDDRNLRRSVKRFWRYLHHAFIRLELQARQEERLLRCHMGLPQQAIVLLGSQETAVREAIFRLLSAKPYALLIHGPSGAGKTSIALQMIETLLCEQIIDEVAWIDLRSIAVGNLPKNGQTLAMLICQALHLEFSAYQTPIERLGLHLATLQRQGQQLIIGLDMADGWQTAIEMLWTLLSYTILITTTRQSFSTWHGLAMTNPSLTQAEAERFLKWLDKQYNFTWLDQADRMTAHQQLIRLGQGNLGRLRRAHHLFAAFQREVTG